MKKSNKDKKASGEDKKVSGDRTLKKILSDASLREAFFCFALTRAILFIIFFMVGHLTLTGQGEGLGKSIQDPVIAAGNQSLTLSEIVIRGDANRYITIARDGYEVQPFSVDKQYNWAFFPLQPLLLRLFGAVTGEYPITGVVLSNILFFISLVLLHKITLEFGYDAPVAGRAVFYFAAFPVSYFLSLPLSESLFIALTLAGFYAARRERWLLAAVLGALGSATRLTGVFLLPVFLLMYWQKYRSWSKPNWAFLLMIPTGLIAFMIYLWKITGNALAFADIQIAYARRIDYFLSPIIGYISSMDVMAVPWDFRLLNFAAAILAFVCIYILVKRQEWALALYTFLLIAPPLFNEALMSFARYVLAVFPVFIALALKGESSYVDQTIRTIFLILFGLMAALFAAHFSIAMA